jgi:hypothetical protein
LNFEFFIGVLDIIIFEKTKRREIFMDKKKAHTPGEELMQTVYKNVKMGSDAVTSVIEKTKDANLRHELTSQLESYYGFTVSAKNKLAEMHCEAKEPGMLSKLPADFSIKMTTMMDSSDSKIAEIMIDGYNMGIIDLQKSINSAKDEGAPEDVMNIAQGVMAFEEGSIEKMKQYL